MWTIAHSRNWIVLLVLLMGGAGLAATKLITKKSSRYVAPGTQRMAARLAVLARTARPETGHNNQELIDQMRFALSQPLPDD